MSKIKTFAVFGTLSFLSDQATKWILINQIPPHGSVPLFFSIVRFTHVRNPMAAWGLPIGGTLSLIVLPLAIVIVILVYRLRAHTLGEKIALSVVLGGAAGNFLDRIRWGYVVDFIDIGIGNLRWPVFNLADVYVTLGICLIIYDILRKRR